MLLKFATACRSRSQWLGSLHGLAVEPAEKLLLKVIVEGAQAEPLVRVRVAFGRIDQADADQIVLGMSAEEFQALAQAEADGAARRRGPAGRRRRGDEPSERILTARSKVECRDGEAGSLAGVVVDSRTGDLEGIVLPMGMPMTRDVLVPADNLAEIRDDRVVLKFDLDDLAGMPTLRT